MLGELRSSRIQDGDVSSPRLGLRVLAWKLPGGFHRYRVSLRGQPVAVLFYDFHSFGTAAVGGRRAVTGPPNSSAMACVNRGGNWEDPDAAPLRQASEAHFGEGAGRQGLGGAQSPHAVEQAGSISALSIFNGSYPQGWCEAVVYMTPCWAE